MRGGVYAMRTLLEDDDVEAVLSPNVDQHLPQPSQIVN